MKVVILDEHPLEDGRVGRHIKYLLQNNWEVYRLHFSAFAPELEPGQFSLYGEKGFRITPPSSDMRILNFFVFNTLYLLPSLFAPRIEKALKEMDVDMTAPTILHIHDPCLLKIAMVLKEKFFTSARIVYDRHEFYEMGSITTWQPILTRGKYYETATGNEIDGVAHASLGGKADLKALFPVADHTHIPNFPQTETYDEAHILEKVRSFGRNSVINVLYVGSLSPLDRDVKLLVKIASNILDNIPNTSVFIGGPTHGQDEELRAMMSPLQEKYNSRFRFHLGYVPRNEAQKLNENSHVGFHLIKPETKYWVTGSPNKVFEYLRCGMIPILRASIEFSEDILPCSLQFTRYTPDEEIILQVRQLLSDPDRCGQMMKDALRLSSKFSFEAVAPNYLKLYDQIWDHSSQSLTHHEREQLALYEVDANRVPSKPG